MAALGCWWPPTSPPAGSTAYNLSAQGPILPINAALLALTLYALLPVVRNLATGLTGLDPAVRERLQHAHFFKA